MLIFSALFLAVFLQVRHVCATATVALTIVSPQRTERQLNELRVRRIESLLPIEPNMAIVRDAS
jgi:hypothetical protein